MFLPVYVCIEAIVAYSCTHKSVIVTRPLWVPYSGKCFWRKNIVKLLLKNKIKLASCCIPHTAG